MSFNPLMTAVLAGLRPLLPEQPTMVEFGNQTFNTDNAALDFVLGQNHPGFDRPTLQALRDLGTAERATAAQRYVRALGFADYQAIDINDRHDSLIMDLNDSLVDRYHFAEQFDLVTNNGTGEHCFDQHSICRNAHDLTRPGGLMLHIMPFVEYVNHGFYSFHPNLYCALAQANNYELLAMGVATRSGDGILARGDAGRTVPQLFMNEQRVAMSTLLSESKPDRSGPLGVVRGTLKRLVKRTAGDDFNQALRRLQRQRPKLLLLALLRRTNEAPFRKPIQIRYADEFGDEEMERAYLG